MGEEDNRGEKETGHTAIVFFHGIGNPRKLGTLASFLDEFDMYGSRQDRNGIGIPRNFRHKIEEDSDRNSRSLVQFRRITKFKNKDVQAKIVRAYEGYWGDDIPESISPISFFIWLVRILITSLRIYFSSWRRYPLHRIRSLHHVEEELKGAQSREKLEALYRKFVSTQGVDRFPKGRFSDFQRFLNDKAIRKQYGDFSSIAVKWRDRERISILSFAASLTFSTIVFLVAAFSLFAIAYHFLHELSVDGSLGSLAAVVVSAAITSILVWLAWQPVKQRISDVFFWTTYDERARGYAIKEKRISQATELILSVISNPRCNDCIIVGHSLGSAIAIDALFRIAERSAALDLPQEAKENRLREFRKIKFLFLAGSPFDNIFSLFQEDHGGSHRFGRIQEQKSPTLRGAPFQDTCKDRGITIINFWSRFDPISARIFSLRTPDNHRRRMIYNCESIPSGAPLPLPAHSGYFSDPKTMQILYRAVMTGKYSEEQLPDEKLSLRLGAWAGLGLLVSLILLIAQVISIFNSNILLLISSSIIFSAVSMGSLIILRMRIKGNMPDELQST